MVRACLRRQTQRRRCWKIAQTSTSHCIAIAGNKYLKLEVRLGKQDETRNLSNAKCGCVIRCTLSNMSSSTFCWIESNTTFGHSSFSRRKAGTRSSTWSNYAPPGKLDVPQVSYSSAGMNRATSSDSCQAPWINIMFWACCTSPSWPSCRAHLASSRAFLRCVVWLRVAYFQRRVGNTRPSTCILE